MDSMHCDTVTVSLTSNQPVLLIQREHLGNDVVYLLLGTGRG